MRSGRPQTPDIPMGTQLSSLLITGKTSRVSNGARTYYYECVCLCGNTCVVSKSRLKSHPDTKCGSCAGKQGAKKRGADGRSSTPEWLAWKSMRERCSRPQHSAYVRYGARGISVCERWESFDNFLADMGSRPSAKHSLDRVDNDGNYSPDNCRWATAAEQNANQRTNAKFTLGGKTQHLAAWAKELGCGPTTLWLRMNRYGWSVEDALATPVGSKAPNKPGSKKPGPKPK